MKLLVIDEHSMVSSNLQKDIDSRLRGIFMTIPVKAFADLSVMDVADLCQLPPEGKLICSQFSDKNSMKHLLGVHLWHIFRYSELLGVVRQNDKLFIVLSNKVRVCNVDDYVEN